MTHILVRNGGTIFRRYVKEVRNANHANYFTSKTVTSKTNPDWKKTYYYKRVPRTEAEKLAMIADGHKPNSAHVLYHEQYLGPDKPDGFRDDALTALKYDQKLTLKGRDLVTTADQYEELKKHYPNFRELEVLQLQNVK